MRHFALLISYDGTHYAGFQRQINGLAVQEVLEKAFVHLFKQMPQRISPSGRTDAGVHAIGQVISLSFDARIEENKLATAFNTCLPYDVRVLAAAEVPESFSARYSAKNKTYAYIFHQSRSSDLFLHNFTWRVHDLNVQAIREAAAEFIGTHDFSAFCATGSAVKSHVRTVTRLDITQKDELLLMHIEANGFLYNMVRIIAGTLYQVGLGKIKPEDIPAIIASKDRTLAGETAPPQGLFLVRVIYEDLCFSTEKSAKTIANLLGLLE